MILLKFLFSSLELNTAMTVKPSVIISCYLVPAQQSAVFEQFHLSNYTHKDLVLPWNFFKNFPKCRTLRSPYQADNIRQSPSCQGTVVRYEIWTHERFNHSDTWSTLDHARLCTLFQETVIMVCSTQLQYKTQVDYVSVEQTQMSLSSRLQQGLARWPKPRNKQPDIIIVELILLYLILKNQV